MSRTRLSVGFAAIIALALALPPSTPALAQGPMGPGDGSMMGQGMMGPQSTMGRSAMRGCGSSRPTVPPSSISDLPRVTINVYDGFYDPVDVTVVPGTVIVWVNRGTKPHSTTSWDYWSEVLHPGERCAAWFVTPGTYPYLSIVTADGGGLMGSVTVAGPPIPGGSSAASPGASPMGTGTGPGSMGPGTGPGSMGPGTGSGTGN
jgi:plastocyanin